ncbi:MAG TPA: hypothetical protein V6D20_07980, partial [Candidatus Obscuribacterales bacterium]
VSWFGHRDKQTRDEAFAFVTELQRWVGGAVEPSVEKLQPVQAKELHQRFEESQKPAAPERYTRSQQDQAPPAGASSAAQEAAEPEEVDPFDFMEEVDILSKLNSDWFSKVEEKKWQLRKEATAELLELASNPRLKAGDYGQVTRVLQHIISKDININVCQDAITICGKLAAGLRRDFSADAKQLVAPLLGRFKEKKPTVVKALQETMLNMALSINVPDDVLGDVTEASKSKIPTVREQTWGWLLACFKTPKHHQRQFKSLKALCALLVTAMDDATPAVRNTAAEVFGVLAGVVGERMINPYIQRLDDIKQKKVRELMPENTVAPPPKAAPMPEPEPSKPAPRSAPAAQSAPPVTKRVV